MGTRRKGNEWRQLSSESLLVTPHLEIHREHLLRPDGRPATYDVFWLPRDAVVIVPTRKRSELLMIRQFRPPIRKESYEIPAGGMDDGETPAQAARRELIEETGWDCPKVRTARTYYPMAGRSNVRFHIMHAPEPVCVGSPTDPDETEEVFWADQARFATLWNKRHIHAGATITAVLLAVSLRWLDWTLGDVLLEEEA